MKKRMIFQGMNIILIIVFLLLRFIFFDKIEFSDLKSLEFIIVCMIFYSLIYFYYENKYIGIKFLFIGVFILYSLTRIFMDTFDMYPIDKIRLYDPNLDITKEFILILALSFYSLNLGLSKRIKVKKIKEVKKKLNLSRNSMIYMLIGFIPYFIMRIDKILVALIYGRVNVYRGMRIFPSWIYRLGLLNYVFLVGFFMYILVSKKNKIKNKMIAVYSIIALLLLLTGFRGQGFKDLLSLFVIYCIRKKYKPNLIVLGINGFLFMIISRMLFLFRNGYKLNEFGIFELIKPFLLAQGKSSEILYFSIILKEKLMFITPFTDPLKGVFRRLDYLWKGLSIPSGQTLERLKYTDNLSPHITYILEPVKYLNGGGIGNFALAEVYLYGDILFVVLTYYLLGYFLSKLEKTSENNNYYLVFLAIIVNIFLTQPRGPFFPSINIILVIILLLIGLKKLKLKGS